MTRSILLLLAGAASGAAVTWALLGGSALGPSLPSYADGAADAASPLDAAAAGTGADGASSPVSRLTVLYQLAATSDRRDLRRLLDDAARLPASRDRDVTVEVLLQHYAELDPADALRHAVEIGGTTVAPSVVASIGAVWGGSEPEAALTRAESIGDPRLRAAFEHAVLLEWAAIDIDAALEHMLASERMRPAAFGPAGRVGNAALLEIARSHPVPVLQAAERFRPPLNSIVQQVALSALADRDPLGAIRHAEAAPPAMRQSGRQAAALAWGRNDPDAALEWARRTAPNDRLLLSAVIRGIAESDPERAMDIALGDPDRSVRTFALPTAVASLAAGGGDVGAVADRLAAQSDAARNDPLNIVTSVWASIDPRAAIDWLVSNLGRIDTSMLFSAARQLASQDPDLAASYLHRLPDAVRPRWIAAVAAGYAPTDTDRAAEWLERLRGQPAYASAAATVAQHIAQRDPEAAARLIDGVGNADGQTVAIASSIVAQWVLSDPLAAVSWAQGLQDRNMRSASVRNAASSWAGHDWQAARDWALGLPRDEERDAVLTAVVHASLSGPEAPVDRAVFAAFSDDRARQQAILPIVIDRLRHEPNEGRALMDEYLTDPHIRNSAEQAAAVDEESFPVGLRTGFPVSRPPMVGIGSSGQPVLLRAPSFQTVEPRRRD